MVYGEEDREVFNTHRNWKVNYELLVNWIIFKYLGLVFLSVLLVFCFRFCVVGHLIVNLHGVPKWINTIDTDNNLSILVFVKTDIKLQADVYLVLPMKFLFSHPVLQNFFF